MINFVFTFSYLRRKVIKKNIGTYLRCELLASLAVSVSRTTSTSITEAYPSKLEPYLLPPSPLYICKPLFFLEKNNPRSFFLVLMLFLFDFHISWATYQDLLQTLLSPFSSLPFLQLTLGLSPLFSYNQYYIRICTHL
jgi:hypothetical protein